MKKKLLSLALALTLCLGLTVPAFAANPRTFHAFGVYFQVSDVLSEKEGYVWYDPINYYLPADATITITEGPLEEDEYHWTSFTIAAENDEGDLATIDNEVLQFNKTYTLADLKKLIQDNADPADVELVFGTGEFFLSLEASYATGNGNLGLSQMGHFHFGAQDTPAAPSGPAVSDWAKDKVAEAQEKGLVPDGLGGDYRVEITRAQFAAAAVKLYEAMSGGKAPETVNNPFTDTSDPVILQAAALGFVRGVGDGKFAPGKLVTREQASVMLSSVYTKLGGEVPAASATAFADDGSVSGWAKNAVAFMNGKEIIAGVGDNRFNPQGSATIEQALAISLKMFQTLK